MPLRRGRVVTQGFYLLVPSFPTESPTVGFLFVWISADTKDHSKAHWISTLLWVLRTGYCHHLVIPQLLSPGSGGICGPALLYAAQWWW